jgi:uncharacterized membrane protein YphA (DoxX/SURF4 family)
MSFKHRAGTWASIVLGLIFMAAGFGKLFSPAYIFKLTFNPFPGFISTAFSNSVFHWLPYLEIIIGVLLIIGIMPRFAAVLAGLLIAGFITHNAWRLNQGLAYTPCTCFGVLDRILGLELSTTDSLYLDIAMLVLAFLVIFCHKGRFFNIRPRFFSAR